MKLKYYLRGLGIGIAVTVCIMALTSKPEEMTDAQIKIRAAQLGMVEESVLADLQENNNVPDEPVEESKEETIEEISSEEAEAVEEMTTEEAETVEEVTAEEAENIEETTDEGDFQKDSTDIADESEEEKTSNITVVGSQNSADSKNTTEENIENYVLITIESGSNSHTVSKKLYEAGLIDSIEEYDEFLMINEYDRKLIADDHEIPVGATERQIARILCGME